jgi:hypothetical protein
MRQTVIKKLRKKLPPKASNNAWRILKRMYKERIIKTDVGK